MEVIYNNLPTAQKKHKKCFHLRSLRLSLKYRPDVYKLILKMRHKIRRKADLLKKLQEQLKKQINSKIPTKDSYTQTDNENTVVSIIENNKTTDHVQSEIYMTKTSEAHKPTKKDITESQDGGWSLNDKSENEKSIADQVKEVAQSALQQTGMVYVESAGMYYDYKTGYYYSSELGLYYHPDTGCYYSYSEDKKSFEFHSYPDRSKTENPLYEAHERKKAKAQKKARKREENEIDNLTKNLSQVSLRGQTALDSIAKHHPPCMRIIVRETNLSKLKVGSLFLVTKDGGTVGREGKNHAILIEDHNVSRTHLDIKYDMSRKMYTASDLGSKNGTTLNGVRMSESQVISEPMEVMHGSTIQLGETKLLCHIHPGVDTCGHCEPGLVMEIQDKEKKAAYTRTCSVQKQHQLELARLKNKYAPKPLSIEATEYNDRAKSRREKVGSSHHSVKTQSADLETFIAPENKGFKLLEKMGWSKGEGLGKDNQGDTEPVPLLSNEGKSGLGTSGGTSAPPLVPTMVPKNTLGPATMRLAARTKMLQPPAKAFQGPVDDEESE